MATQARSDDVVFAYVRTHVDQLTAWDPKVRQDEPDSVHKMRVATRRLRGTLQSFRRFFDPEQARQLEVELKWLGGLLGQARDEEVLCEHLVADLSRLPAELVVGPVQARIVGHFAPRQAAGRADVLTALDGDRYAALLVALDALLGSPTQAAAAGRPAAKELPKTVGKALRRVNRRMKHAVALPHGEEREIALHQARKAAKRARYAAEALEPVARKKSRRSVKTMTKLQTVLGDHQDAVLVSRTVRGLGMLAHMNGENSFTFGVLYERNAATLPDLQKKAERHWEQRRKERRIWES